MDLETVADELYALLPTEFTATRDERAARARRDGDRELAAAIRELRRPTTSAWLANLLVRERGDRIDDLLELGAAMREAQGRLAGEDLRRLTRQRHQVVTALGHEARRLAHDIGQPVSEGVGRELEGTLEAALADPAAGDAVRTGRLTTALAYTGLGPVDVSGAVAAPDSRSEAGGKAAARTKGRGHAAPPARGEEPERRREPIRAAEDALEAARSAAAEAERAAGEHEHNVREATDRHEAIRTRIADLQRQLAEAREGEGAAARDARTAQRERDAAARAARAADERVARARANLDRLRA